MAVARADVEDLDSTGWSQLDDSKKDALLEMARTRVDTVYGGQVSTISIVEEGARDDVIKLIAAHLYELAEGGETTSESSTGGSVNYNSGSVQEYQALSETRYGRQAQDYLQDEAGIGIVRTY